MTATGKESAAGIGGGYIDNSQTSVTIYGGNVKATGVDFAAGIGGAFGRSGNGVPVTIHGGNVQATGGKFTAGIGGAYADDGGTVVIDGGNVLAGRRRSI